MQPDTLRTAVRKAVKKLEAFTDETPMESVEAIVAPLRDFIKPDTRLGQRGMTDGSDECVEWYAGQLLSIVDKKAWYAINSIINCLDRFCPELKEKSSNTKDMTWKSI